MKGSIRWKFVLIYFMLIFIAMVVAGIFIIQYIQEYHFSVASRQLQEISNFIMPQLENYDDFDKNSEKIQEFINGIQSIGIYNEIYVINKKNNKIIATTTEMEGENAEDVLSFDLLIEALNGHIGEAMVKVQVDSEKLRVKDLSVPIFHHEKVIGVLYLRMDLHDIFETLNKSVVIIIQSIIISSVFIFILVFFISQSITRPINDISRRVESLAQGDFDQVIEVYSNDEIGKLAQTFNFLTKKLSISLKEISSEKTKLETVFNHMEDGIIAIDSDQNIMHINPKAIDLLQLSQKSNVLEDINKYLNLDLSLDNMLRMYPSGMGIFKKEIQNSYLKFSFASYDNEIGKKRGIIFLIQDVTEIERLEIMRRDFVANVSHELKTPLTSIKSYTETLLSGVDDLETRELFLGVVNSEADRMGRLVRDLLELSNFDAKRVEMNFEYYDYIELINNCILKVQMIAKEKNQGICLDNTYEKLIGYFDYDRMEQVILNILSNAIKYTPNGGDIKIHIELEEKAGTSMINIAVQDTGIGISKKHLDRIFERFYRVDKGRSRAMGGTGLGLSIAREIVQYHHGKIYMTSKVGYGTTVSINLPMEQVTM